MKTKLSEPTRSDRAESGDIGICSTCDCLAMCVYRRGWYGPVFECDEFDNSGAQTPLVATADPPPAMAVAVADPPVSQVGTETAKGLCVDCAHRDHCSLTRPESGIWHCEEYA